MCVREYTQEELESCGTANCGCTHHAEEGIPCKHDLERLRAQKRAEAPTFKIGDKVRFTESYCRTFQGSDRSAVHEVVDIEDVPVDTVYPSEYANFGDEEAEYYATHTHQELAGHHQYVELDSREGKLSGAWLEKV